MSADGMGGGHDRDPEDESFTEMEDVQPDVVEIVPIRHGMVLAGRYAVETILGRGGSGVVVRAHDRDLRVAVAIKILRAELAGQKMWTERLAREVRLARQIHHPNVCRVFDFEQADGRAFVVMELAGKGTLRDELRTGALAARPLAERIADARAVVSALEAIHRAGIIHRDVSPQNLLRMGDGRLVVSDFGLAVDVSESTSSVHGGTVSYMAPEVLRGGAATFASDIWGLGIVMHEMVFGMKPRWSEGANPTMLPPRLRRLTLEERAVFETCRACTAFDPADRLVREGDVARMLAERPRWWRWRRWRPVPAPRPLVVASALTLVAAAAVGGMWARRRAPDLSAQSKPQSPLIIPTGEPADWTDVSTVLAEVPERIVCTRLLPDQRTIRFVWGTPPHAEDIDVVTRKRVPSPIVQGAYAEGCPDLSPDGKRLVYQGHASDGRAVAFLSEHPDGKDAVPIVQTAEPSMSSEPTWLADGRSFSYDADFRHAGVFATANGRVRIVPEATLDSFMTMSRFSVAQSVFVELISSAGDAEIIAVSVPSMRSALRFRVPEAALDLVAQGSHFYYTSWKDGSRRALIEVDLAPRTARAIGQIRDQVIRYPTFAAGGLTFASISMNSELAVRQPGGGWTNLTKGQKIWSAARCGRDLFVAADDEQGTVIKRLDGSGKVIESLTKGPLDSSVACSAESKIWFYSSYRPQPVLRRCDERGCRPILARSTFGLAVSPDGTRLVFGDFDSSGVTVYWMGRDGGPIHKVAETDTVCAPGWASNQTVWVSQRRLGKVVWIEIDADSGRETGKTVSGSHDCADGRSDPDSPVNRDIKVVRDQTSQLRLLDGKFLRWN